MKTEEFSFDSRNSSPYSSAPSSPHGFNKYYFSPTHTFYRQISFSFTPLSQLPNNYQQQDDDDDDDDDMNAFVFNSIPDLPTTLSSADELFDGGKIKVREPTMIPPKKILKNTLSFGRNNKVCSDDHNSKDFSDSSSSSLSWLYKKWNLKDLLFRNASEGHETNKKKYDFLRIFHKNEEMKNPSVHIGVIPGGKKKKKERALTAHERHYKVKRAAAEEEKKKTYLPYNHKLMMGGCIHIDAAGVRHPSRPPVTPRRP